MKHTPGPWGVHLFDSLDRFEVQAVNLGEDGQGVLFDLCTEFVSPEEAEANANLCAAAPDLLEAIGYALVQIQQDNTERNIPVQHRKTEDMVRAAIRKAKGEK